MNEINRIGEARVRVEVSEVIVFYGAVKLPGKAPVLRVY